jgi:hypothetical protein
LCFVLFSYPFIKTKKGTVDNPAGGGGKTKEKERFRKKLKELGKRKYKGTGENSAGGKT